ncbi:MAG: DUF2141 domain-containing protein [Candidatus Kapabacteria bacterium]|nr:DUF2141 domain-containing protein [Candidatus Kapabacteria bacterium]
MLVENCFFKQKFCSAVGIKVRLVFVLTLLIFFPIFNDGFYYAFSQNVRVSFSSNSTTDHTNPEKGKLIIQVNNLKNNDGKIIFHLFNTETGKYFPTKSDNSSLRVDSKISKNQVRITIEDLPYGNYAYTLHHDENDNKKMDKTWLGLPAEGWALSNEIKPVLSLPDFDEGKFLLNKPKMEITTTLNY